MKQFLKRSTIILTGIAGSFLLVGCSGGGAPSGAASSQSAVRPDNEKYLLKAEPGGAQGVKDVRRDAKDGEEVVILGHIGGDAKPWVEGRAAFWIVDPSVKPCLADEGCPTPWDCCCHPKEELVKAMATVKIVDDQNQTVPIDARQLLGVKESQMIVAHGRAKRDEKGNLTVLAHRVFVRQ
jgi:hypothetical protein